MDKAGWKKWWKAVRQKLQLLNPLRIDDDEEAWEDYDLRDDYISGEENANGGLRSDTAGPSAPASISISRTGLIVLLVLLCAIAAWAYHFASHRHLYTDYKVSRSYESTDVTGTSYRKLGTGFVKYGSDGLFVVNGRNETQWSMAYTLQAPIADVRGSDMVLASQQGTQVVLINQKGSVGSFETDLPILKVRAAEDGICAIALKDDTFVRIRIYGSDGTTVAEIRTSLEDSGYPIDFAISPNGSQMIVSSLSLNSGSETTTIRFYDFRHAAGADSDHLSAEFSYDREVFPEVYYTDDAVPVAIGSGRFVCYTKGTTPKEDAVCEIADSILSTFHDDENVGFILQGSGDDRYRMQIYRNSGKLRADTAFNSAYSSVKMDLGEVLLTDGSRLVAFTADGIPRLDTDYSGSVEEFFNIPGFRQYMVLNNTEMATIYAE